MAANANDLRAGFYARQARGAWAIQRYLLPKTPSSSCQLAELRFVAGREKSITSPRSPAEFLRSASFSTL
jgi:hypothetical protein